jgi:hypothetical protein
MTFFKADKKNTGNEVQEAICCDSCFMGYCQNCHAFRKELQVLTILRCTNQRHIFKYSAVKQISLLGHVQCTDDHCIPSKILNEQIYCRKK